MPSGFSVEMELLIQAKDAEITRLVAEKNLLLEKLLAITNPVKKELTPKVPLKYDEKTKTLRAKTPQEISEEMSALKELGIC